MADLPGDFSAWRTGYPYFRNRTSAASRLKIRVLQGGKEKGQEEKVLTQSLVIQR